MSEKYKRFSAWQPLLPDEFKHRPEAYWRARSGRGDWAAFVKPLGERDVARWDAAQITAQFKEKFGALFPESVQALLAAGFPDVPQPKTPKSKTKKPKAKKNSMVRS